MFPRLVLALVAVAACCVHLSAMPPRDRPLEPRVPKPVLAKVIDLRSQQTPIRDQGNGRTCIVYSVSAAMEAALGRAGRKNIDLSEDTFMYFVKMFWLGKQPSAGVAENQLGGTAGGNGVENLNYLAGGLAIPEEAYGRSVGYDYQIPVRTSAHWSSQFNSNSWTLSPKRLPTNVLYAPRYFTVSSFNTIGAKNANEIEAALRGGREVIWDFTASGNRPTNAMWTHNGPSKEGDGSHSMLIVGYNKLAPRPYFIVKNSWGKTTTPGANGFTYISYDYLKYGSTAGVITGVKQKGWDEVRFIGRWALNYDGWQGVLDISHVPGVMQGPLKLRNEMTVDRRVGTFYENGDPNKARRVNGSMRGNQIDFYIDETNHNAAWDKLAGRHFTYRVSHGDKDFMAGTHKDPDGKVWGGFARRLKSDAAFPDAAKTINVASLPEMAGTRPASRLPVAVKPESYFGTWKVAYDTTAVTVVLNKRDDAAVPLAKRVTHFGVSGPNAVLLVNKRNPMEIELLAYSTPSKSKLEYRFSGRLLSWERGVVGGTLIQPRVNGPSGAALVRAK